MNRREEPVRTYRGRPLPRQHEDVDDQGLGFDIATVMSRRRLLSAFGLGAVGVGLAACSVNGSTATTAGSTTASSSASASSSDLTEIPDETAGPYPGDGSNGANVLTESGVVRSDIRSSFGTSTTTAPGVPMTLTLNVRDMVNDDAAFEGAAVYVWHCDRDGNYSLYAGGLEDENYLRGVQVVNASGTVTFTSIFPACYSGRWPHLHFEVYPSVDDATTASNKLRTSQIAFPEDICNEVYGTADGYDASVQNLAQVSLDSDNVFGDGHSLQLAALTGSVDEGYTLKLNVPV